MPQLHLRERSWCSDAAAVQIPIGKTSLRGQLLLQPRARGLVIVGNGDGDHVYDETNGYIARMLYDAGFAVLVVELLTPNETVEDAETSALRFRHRLLAARLLRVTRWVHASSALKDLDIGLFASGLCGGAALLAGSVSSSLNAVVCRGARIDFAVPQLPWVRAEVLLLVGERDTAHLGENSNAVELLPAGARLDVVPDAGHLLDDAEPLRRVARETESWFARTLDPGATRGAV